MQPVSQGFIKMESGVELPCIHLNKGTTLEATYPTASITIECHIRGEALTSFRRFDEK